MNCGGEEKYETPVRQEEKKKKIATGGIKMPCIEM